MNPFDLHNGRKKSTSQVCSGQLRNSGFGARNCNKQTFAHVIANGSTHCGPSH